MYKLYFDASLKNNVVRCGSILFDNNHEVLSVYIEFNSNKVTSNSAEFISLLSGLQTLHKLGIKSATVIGDSQSVIDYCLKKKKPKHKSSKKFYAEFLELEKKFDFLNLVWVPRMQNLADRYCK